ncbi:hypothetical protein QUB63_14575 [Microcoleus sp. ARI1-B5]|uniref:hypothetical protein n=1 Tax=unclassified Microcoleus TaxID=2642155 RepID=UPI002FCED182
MIIQYGVTFRVKFVEVWQLLIPRSKLWFSWADSYLRSRLAWGGLDKGRSPAG